ITETLSGFVLFDLKFTFGASPERLLLAVFIRHVPRTAEFATIWTNLKRHSSNRLKLFLQSFEKLFVVQDLSLDRLRIRGAAAFHYLPQLVVDLGLVRRGVRLFGPFFEICQYVSVDIHRHLYLAVLEIRVAGLRTKSARYDPVFTGFEHFIFR